MRKKVSALLLIASLISIAVVLRIAAGTPARAAVAPTSAAAQAFYSAPFEIRPSAKSMTAVGRLLFFDPAMSASGKMACASCHDPAHAYAPANAQAVQLGGPQHNLPGVRAVPSLRYLNTLPPFSEHYSEDDGNDSIDQGPTGGHDWDGRAQSAHEQATAPLFSPFEMANTDANSVVDKVRRAAYADQFRQTFGAHVFDDPQLAFKGVQLALEVFQQDPAEFYPYNSKYDAYLRHQLSLSEREASGLALFNDPAKGNCAVCHPSAGKAGAFPQFTDFGFIAVGVPRNRKIPANRDPNYFDLGLCGPLRTDLAERREFCGAFRTPSLRNVAQRQVYFHNGVFTSLKQVLEFYVQRDTQPGKWYARDAHGKPRKFDDLPTQYAANVNIEAPFDRHPGDAPALSASEIDDVIAFLQTLNDGYKP